MTTRSEMNLPELIERFASEDRCREYLEELSWSKGITCPRCNSAKNSRIVKRFQFDAMPAVTSSRLGRNHLP